MSLRTRVVGSLVFVGLVAILIVGSAGPSEAAHEEATPCASPSPVATPATAVPACHVIGPQVDRGTPATVDEVTVELTVSSDQAGPVALVVKLTDQEGGPVNDAAVVVEARHLEMDMGAFPYDALPSAPGVYTADRVAMGMGGKWRVKVEVDRPGHEPFVVFFRVSLEGPQ